jgi:hypothetical protein
MRPASAARTSLRWQLCLSYILFLPAPELFAPQAPQQAPKAYMIWRHTHDSHTHKTQHM